VQPSQCGQGEFGVVIVRIEGAAKAGKNIQPVDFNIHYHLMFLLPSLNQSVKISDLR
jgi:hypothetical protein